METVFCTVDESVIAWFNISIELLELSAVRANWQPAYRYNALSNKIK